MSITTSIGCGFAWSEWTDGGVPMSFNKIVFLYSLQARWFRAEFEGRLRFISGRILRLCFKSSLRCCGRKSAVVRYLPRTFFLLRQGRHIYLAATAVGVVEHWQLSISLFQCLFDSNIHRNNPPCHFRVSASHVAWCCELFILFSISFTHIYIRIRLTPGYTVWEFLYRFFLPFFFRLQFSFTTGYCHFIPTLF